jgi:hypothetical protein
MQNGIVRIVNEYAPIEINPMMPMDGQIEV